MGTRTKVARAAAALALIGVVAGSAARVGAQESVTVPLQLVPIGGGALKVGIEISLAHGAPRLYTFDTGSSGFYAAYNPLWWSSYEPTGGGAIEQSYGDGAVFRSTPVRTTVGIATDAGEIEAEVDMGKIDDAYGGPLGPEQDRVWLDQVAQGHPPLFGHFFGDFGSGLRDAHGLFAVLPQLPGNLSSGFAVQLGCGGGSAPKVTIGLTDAIRSRAAVWAPMVPGEDGVVFPHSGRPTYAQAVLRTSFALRRGADSYSFDADSILDTGAPTTGIHEGDSFRIPDAFFASPDRRDPIRTGVRYRATAAGADGGGDFDLSLVTGTSPGFNLVDVSQVDGAGEVNLGLIPYLRWNVVFDVARGLVGFAPCSPRGGGHSPLPPSGLPRVRRTP